MKAQRKAGRLWRAALALIAGTLLILGVSAAHVPGPWHHDEPGQTCPVCKLGFQPVPLVPASLLVEPPAPTRPLVSAPEQPVRLLVVRDLGPSRAPPA